MAPLIVAWPGGIFPTADTVLKGGKRKARTQKKKKRTLKRKSMKSRRRS